MEAKNLSKRRSKSSQVTRDEMAKKLAIDRDKDR